jgi:hypothetical protein
MHASNLKLFWLQVHYHIIAQLQQRYVKLKPSKRKESKINQTWKKDSLVSRIIKAQSSCFLHQFTWSTASCTSQTAITTVTAS